MAVHKGQDRRPPPSVTGTAPTRGPRKRVDTHASIPLCGAASIAAREPGGYAAARNTHVGFFVLLWALYFIQALVIPIAVERAPEGLKLKTDVAAASPLTAGSGPLPAGFGVLERLGMA
ncbi:hypothetical protein C8R45DRAFT_939832 [Mycena sanguinolenta]|nr:hypothetical protein C8R45DRAFT_939832 [Mycena sanguinolenta]